MSLGSGQDQIKAQALDPRFGMILSQSGGREAPPDLDSPTSRWVTTDWRRVREFQSGAFASATKVRSLVEATEVLAFLREVPVVGQFRGAESGETITVQVESPRRSPYHGRITGPIKFISQLLVTWRLDADSACTLLGFELSDTAYIHDVLRGYASLRGRDAKDRIAHLVQIRMSLSALFEDEAVENEWLREPHEVLNGKTPVELLLEGSMENLLLVKEYVELVAGR